MAEKKNKRSLYFTNRKQYWKIKKEGWKHIKNKTLSNEINKEGSNTWGCKEGWLDVEDVKDFIKKLEGSIRNHFETHKRYGKSTEETKMRFGDIMKDLHKFVGNKLI